MQRRTLGALIALVGVAFLVTVFGNGLFGASSAWEDLSDDVRPVYTDEAIAELRADAARLRAVGEEFNQNVVPTIANALGVSAAELAGRFAADFPATSAGVVALPTIAGGLEQRAALLESQQGNFRSADAIPTDDGSAVMIPWFITITGTLAIIAGLLMMTAGRAIPAAAVALGIVMVAVPIVTTLPSKAADADALNEAVAPLFTQESIQASQSAIDTLEAMAEELSTSLIPGLAQQLGMTPAQAQAFLADNFPTITGALQQFPATIGRAQASTDLIAANTDEFADVRDVPNQTVAWTVVAGGLATIVLASIALAMNQTAVGRAEARRTRRMRRAA